MHRHSATLPAVVVLFLDCEESPGQPNWRQREVTLLSEIERVKQGTRTKSIKLLVVLVKGASSNPLIQSTSSTSIFFQIQFILFFSFF
ncbi:MAG: hypothetical protein Q8P67_17650 [archaeon]|nr:hypothetical protein [archaeon]